MPRLRGSSVILIALSLGRLLFAACACAQTSSGFGAPAVLPPNAGHHVAHVTTQPDVRLEVLDWGGHGPPLVFLAGFGNSSHVFDAFAPQFTNRFHVLGITRRGFGGSSRPSGGYDTGTLVGDIIAVLDTLGIRRASFVGHSFAGTELDFLGAYHPDRVASMVYLDASYDFALLYRDPRWRRAFPVPKPPIPSTTALPVLRRWLASVMGPGVPDDEIRDLTTTARGSPSDTTLQKGVYPIARGRITSPVLAVWATPRSVRDWYPYWGSLEVQERSRLETSFEDQRAVRREHLAMFRDEVPTARLMLVAGARHFLFLTHPRRVAAEMRAFFASVGPQLSGR